MVACARLSPLEQGRQYLERWSLRASQVVEGSDCFVPRHAIRKVWTDVDEVLVLLLTQAGHEHLDRNGFDLFGLGKLLVEGAELALLRQSGHQPFPQRVAKRVAKRATRRLPRMRSLDRFVLAAVLQCLDELRCRLRCRVEDSAVNGPSCQRSDFVVVAPSNPLETAKPGRQARETHYRSFPPSCAS